SLLLQPLRGRKISYGRANRAPDKKRSGSSSRRSWSGLARRQIAGDTRQSHFRRPAAMTEISATSSGTSGRKSQFHPSLPIIGAAKDGGLGAIPLKKKVLRGIGVADSLWSLRLGVKPMMGERRVAQEHL